MAETQPQVGRVPWVLVERAGGVALVLLLWVCLAESPGRMARRLMLCWTMSTFLILSCKGLRN